MKTHSGSGPPPLPHEIQGSQGIQRTQLTDWRDLFLGRDAEIGWLIEAWRLAKSGQPQFRVLRAESGLGKTKIVQEFYHWLSLRENADPNNYWPDFLTREKDNLRLNPRFPTREKIESIPYLWWGLRWSDPADRNRDEVTRCAFFDTRHHLQPHWENLKAFKDVAGDVAGVALEIVSAFAGPLGLIKSAHGVLSKSRELASELGENRLSVAERQEQALQAQIDAIVEFLEWVLGPFLKTGATALPVVLILDDAHWIDPRSLQVALRLFSKAMRRNWPLLVVATHWEREWHEHAEAGVETTFAPVFEELCALSPPGHCEVRDLSKLSTLDQERILTAAFRGLTAEQAASLAKRADGNPRMLHEIALWLERKPHFFDGEAPETAKLLPAGLAKLETQDFRLHDLQEERFLLLEQHLRRLLALGSAQGMRFLGDLVAEMAEILRIRAQNEAAGLLDRAIIPHAILTRDGHEHEFRFRLYYDLAGSYLDELKETGTLQSTAIREVFLETAAGWVRNGRLGDLSDSEAENLLLLALRDCPRGHPCRVAFLGRLITQYHETGYTVKAESWVEEWLQIVPSGQLVSLVDVPFWEQFRIVEMLIALSRLEEAETRAAALSSLADVLGDSSAEVLSQRFSIHSLRADIAFQQDRLSEALDRYREAETLARLSRVQFGETYENLRNLSISQDRQGNLLSRHNELDAALDLYRQSLATREQIVFQFGESKQSLYDLSISQEYVGNIQVRRNDLNTALESYRQSLATREQILHHFGESRQSLRGLSVSQVKLGDVLMLGDDFDGALELFRQSMGRFEGIVAQFGESCESLRDLSVSQEKVGDVLANRNELAGALELCRKSLATRQRIVAQFGESRENLRDLGVSEDKLGGMLMLCDDLDGALELHLRGLKRHQQIVAQFGESREGLRDVSLSQRWVGDVRVRRNELEDALSCYHESLETTERIVTQFGESRENLCDLSVSLMKIGTTLWYKGGGAEREECVALLERSRILTARRFELYGCMSDEDRNDMTVVLENLITICGELGRTKDAAGYQDHLAEFTGKIP